MSRITLLGGSTDRFVLADGTEGYLEVKSEPTDKQAEKGTPIAVVFVPDYQEPAPELDEPGHEVTAGHPDHARVRAEKQAKLDEDREKQEKEAAKAQDAQDRKEKAGTVRAERSAAEAREEEKAQAGRAVEKRAAKRAEAKPAAEKTFKPEARKAG